MQFERKTRTLSELSPGLILIVIGIIGFCLAQFGEKILTFVPPCLFRLWTGIPCPSCGATRCGLALCNFQFVDAFLENPFFLFLFAALILWGMNTILGVVLGKNIELHLSQREKKIVQRVVVFAIIFNWVYLFFKSVL